MLTWLVDEVESPYGTVATLHWAVPDKAEDGESDAISHLNSTALQVELESAEDQLGAVLWNSNPAALNYLHTHVFSLPPSKNTDASSSPPLRGKNIVELGAGVGCLGIALAMAGARVAVTDMKELLPLMAHNVKLNYRRVQTRSNGAGHCVALQWKWGPTATTSVHKLLQKEMRGQREHRSHSNSGSSSEKTAVVVVVDGVVTAMVESLAKPSDSLIECSHALQSPASSAVSTLLPYHYVILCDALYGNPKDWPALLYTLTELLSTNPEGCEVVNFCEQRVSDVEGAFLKMLDEENARVYVPAAARGTVDDPLWTAVKATALKCAESTTTSTAAVEPHKLREEAASALLNYVLVQRRGAYQWAYTMEEVAEAQSELNMNIRATRIRWTRGKEDAATASSRRRLREAERDAHHSSTPVSKKSKR